MTTVQQFDYEYKLLRLAVIKGELTREIAKDWIKAKGVAVAVQVDVEKEALTRKMCKKRTDRDIPILEDEEK